MLLSGWVTELDLNMRCQMPGHVDSTCLHFAVRANDYELLKQILEYCGPSKIEMGLKDSKGKNALDLAKELEY